MSDWRIIVQPWKNAICTKLQLESKRNGKLGSRLTTATNISVDLSGAALDSKSVEIRCIIILPSSLVLVGNESGRRVKTLEKVKKLNSTTMAVCLCEDVVDISISRNSRNN